MAWSNASGGSSSGTAVDTTLSSSFSVGASSMSAGSVAVVFISKDNSSASSGANNEVILVSDSQNNKWNKCGEYTLSRGSAGAGVTTAIYYSLLTTNLVSSTDVVNIYFSTSVTSKAAVLWNFGIGGNTVWVESTAPGTGSSSAAIANQTISGLTSGEYLFLRSIAGETSSFSSTVTTNYTSTGTNTTSTGGADNTNVEIFGEWRIFTGTGDTVTSSLGSVTQAGVYVALKEFSAGTKYTLSPSVGKFTDKANPITMTASTRRRVVIIS